MSTDADFLGYVEIHARTELALFHREDVQRLLTLAGRTFPIDALTPKFLSVHADVADPLVRAARERAAAP